MAKEWKDKLYEIVYKYEDEIETLKEEVKELTHDKERMQSRIKHLATEKHDT